jgi:SAM-dependent methyltransferase
MIDGSSVPGLTPKIKKWMQIVEETYHGQGFGGVLRIGGWLTTITLSQRCHKSFNSPARFAFQNRKYRYFCHWYNQAYANERTVEIPIVCEIVRSYRGKRILEVGNVLSHHYAVDHEIIDKYEAAPKVINEDIATFKPEGRKYDLIFSISTLEHVGTSEIAPDPMKPLRAIENLRQLLAPGGIIAITIPVGQNPHLDTLLRENRILFTRRTCMKRVSWDNQWQQVELG